MRLERIPTVQVAGKADDAVLETRVNQLAVLYRLTDRLYRAQTLSEVYDAALDAIIEGLGCSRASVLLFDDGGVMRFVAWRGLSNGYRQALEGHSPWKRGDRDPRPIFVEDIARTDEPEAVKRTISEEGIVALGFIPLVARGAVVGKFMTYYDATHDFAADEIDLAVAIARQVGFSIERTRADAQRELLVAELNHRVKNTLAIVQSIAYQTFKGAEVPAATRAAFEGRLVALSAAHAQLTHASWGSTSLGQLATDALQAAGAPEGRLQIRGEEILLPPRHAVAMVLALHELYTNAIKYGALSNDAGRVSLEWERTGGPRLRLRWSEHDGPPVVPPERRGFGTRLVERSLSQDLDADVSLDFRPSGLVCTIDLPLPG